MSKSKQRGPGADLRRMIFERMEATQNAGQLNDQVIVPFMRALEDVCGARGYILNIYSESANLVFTGDNDAAEDLYALIEEYLDSRTAEGEGA